MTQALTVVEVLDRYGLDIDEADVARAFDDELGRRGPLTVPPMSSAEVEYLRPYLSPQAAGALELTGEQLARQAAQVVVDQTMQLLAGSLSRSEAALALGVTPSRVSQLIAKRQLWSFTLGGRQRLPRWQITPEGAVLPGLAVIVPRIPRGLVPLAVEGFMLAEQPEFDGRTAVGFLLAGGEPELVAGLLESLALW
jgi:hypothetical protein